MQKILVIEDEDRVLEVVKVYLEKGGYDVCTADNGKDGLSLFEQNKPHLIVLELTLPDILGEEINLTPVEYKLPMFFVRNPNQVFSKDELIEKVLRVDFEGYDRTIDAHIKNLRRKIIVIVFGTGYRSEGERA